LLSELQQCRPSIAPVIAFEDMCYGFRKWREKPTTSPSRKHLGVYKALLNAVQYNLIPDATNDPQLTAVADIASIALHIQHRLLNLAIRECHSYARWHTVHNFILEKLPGQPLVEKLRVIHIYEADWNFLNRYFAAYKITKMAAKEGSVTEEQAGGRPGRSSSEVAVNTVLTYEVIRLQRLTGAIIYNDAKACFDRVIENFANLCLLQEGYPVKVARLHARTLQSMKYFAKHKLGIGEQPNTHSESSPFLGSGQGAADSPARWGFISDALIRAYKRLANSALIQSPLSDASINHKIQAFVDDTRALIINQQHTPTVELIPVLMSMLQHDSQIWEQLLHSASGKLELPKCRFGIIRWQYTSQGGASLCPSSQQTLSIQDSETHQQVQVPQLEPSDAYKYLGVHIALDGNMKAQQEFIRDKIQRFMYIFSQCYLSQNNMQLCYRTVFTPSIRYGLAATSLDPEFLEKVQRPIITLVLSKLGFNQR
jgi:hypothetical protein